MADLIWSALFSAGDALGIAPSTHLTSDGRGGDRGRTSTPTPPQVCLLSQLLVRHQISEPRANSDRAGGGGPSAEAQQVAVDGEMQSPRNTNVRAAWREVTGTARNRPVWFAIETEPPRGAT